MIRITKSNSINLFWWNIKHFHNKPQENFGDAIGPYLVKKITGKNIKFIHPKKRKPHQLFSKVLVTVGSILGQIDKNCIVWGSGLVEKNTKVPKAKFLAVRGPITRSILINQGCEVPEIYGDPALLLPNFFTPQNEKKYKIGIIPHYVDYEKVFNWYKNDNDILVINLLNDNVEAVITQINSCHKTISSSLHGIIVSNAYHIPTSWVKFSNKIFGDDIKFYDYFESLNILYKCYEINNKIEYEKINKFNYFECEKLKLNQIKNSLLSSLSNYNFN